jgi:hypothetical protein
VRHPTLNPDFNLCCIHLRHRCYQVATTKSIRMAGPAWPKSSSGAGGCRYCVHQARGCAVITLAFRSRSRQFHGRGRARCISEPSLPARARRLCPKMLKSQRYCFEPRLYVLRVLSTWKPLAQRSPDVEGIEENSCALHRSSGTLARLGAERQLR